MKIVPVLSLSLCLPFVVSGAAAQSPCGKWNVVPAPSPAGATQVLLRAVSARAENDAWAVGYYREGTNGTRTLAMHWDGSAWSIVPTPNPLPYPGGLPFNELRAVEMVAGNDVWAAGVTKIADAGGVFTGPQMLILHWDGSSWSRVTAPLTQASTNGAWINDIVRLDTGELFFGGCWVDPTSTLVNRVPLAMRWNGSTFAFESTPSHASGSVSEEYNSVAFVGAEAWGVGRAGLGIAWGIHPLIDRRGGTNWVAQTTPEPGITHTLQAVAAVSATDVWATGLMNTGLGIASLLLHYDGSAWSEVATPGGSSTLLALASDDIWMGGAGLFHWNGTAWGQRESFPSVNQAGILALARIGDTPEIWGVGQQGSPGSQLPLVVRYAEGTRLETTFQGGSGFGAAAAGGADFFDATVVNAHGVTICGIDVHSSAPVGSNLTVRVHQRVGGHVGHVDDASAWRLVAAATTSSMGVDQRTRVTLSPPLHLAEGIHGLAVEHVGAAPVTTDLGTAPTFANADLSLGSGVAQLAPVFGPASTSTQLSPRVWNGAFLYATTQSNGASGYGLIGNGCAGSLGVPGNVAITRPVLGGVLTMVVDRLPWHIGAMVFGASRTQALGFALPLDLGVIGMPGCPLFVSNDLIATLVGTANQASYSWPIPGDPTLLGARFYNQALSFDPGVNAFGFAISDAMVMLLGL